MPELPPLKPAQADFLAVALALRVPGGAPPVILCWNGESVPLHWAGGLGDILPVMLDGVDAVLRGEPYQDPLHTADLDARIAFQLSPPDHVTTTIQWMRLRDGAPPSSSVTLPLAEWLAEWVRLFDVLLAILDGCTTDPRLAQLRRLHERLHQAQQ